MFKLPSKQKLLGIITCVSLTIPSIGHSESLAEIYQLAIKNDAQYKVAQANLNAGKLASKVGLAGLLPQINAEASYSESKGDSVLNSGEEFDAESDSTVYSANISQPLFDAATWYNYKQSKASVSLSEADFGREQQNLILRTAEAYFNSLKAVDDLETAVAEEDALSHSLEQTKQRFEVGLTAITEVHEAQAEFDSARANKLIREGELIIAFEALEVLTGKAHKSVAPLKSNFPVTPPIPQERTEWVAMAKSTNLELQSAKIQLSAAEANYKARRSGHLPTINASLGYSDQTNNNQSPFGTRSTTGTRAAITLSLPIFSGGRISGQRQQAAYQKVSAKETVSQIERKVTQDTRSLHQRVKTGVATVQARQQAIISSESALEATKAGYDVGTRNLVNVLDAQRKVYATKRDFLSTLYDYVLSGLRLKQAAGTLSAADLMQLDQWLNKDQMVGPDAKEQG